MGFSPSPLTSVLQAYIEEQNYPLIARALTSSPTMALAEKQLNVKGKSAINLADIDVTFQDGSGCAWNESGDITLTQRFIDPAKLKLNMEFCPKELEAIYLRTQLPSGAHYETIPFEEFFANHLVGKISAELEKMIWKSVNPLTKTSSLADGTGNYAFFNGFRDAVLGASYINANTTAFGSGTPVGTPLNATNMLEAVQRVYEAAADAVIESDDATVFVGADKFRSMAVGILNGVGSFNTDAGQLQGYNSDMGSLSMVMPGTNLRIQATSGLTEVNDVYLARTSNMFIGMDMDEDASRIESWYSQDDRKFKIAVELTVGAQVAFPDQISVITV
jgi:hypothetical protein